MNSSINVQEIEAMSYVDFVGFINQWNVLPGAFSTLSQWRVFSQLNQDSNILEIACTTGFSSRELALQSKCKGKAFDQSQQAIKAAITNKEEYAPQIKVDYFVADGYTFTTEERFSHVVIGACLKFFPDPDKMLERCIALLQDGGYILASPFYIQDPLPESLISEFVSVFGIRPTTESYKEIMKSYRGLEIIFEERKDLVPETEEELHHYCTSTIERVCAEKEITDVAVRDAMFARLLRIKEMSNKLRKHQGYSVLVLRYRKKVYPKRYVELF